MARSQEWEPLPELPEDVPSPLEYIRGRVAPLLSPYPATNGLDTPNETPKDTPQKTRLAVGPDVYDVKKIQTKFLSKKTGVEAAQMGVLRALDTHGYHRPKDGERGIVWGHTADGMNDCKQFYLKRPVNQQVDVGYCPKCHTPFKFSSHCDSPRCRNRGCANKYAKDKGAGISKFTEIIETSLRVGTSERFHVIVSPPPELSPYWIQNAGHLAELYKVVWDLLETSLGASAGTIVTHPYRGKKDKEITEAREYVGAPELPEDEDNSYFWRVGPHFHAYILALQPRGWKFLRAVCTEIYRLTGFVTKLWTVGKSSEDVQNVVSYQLTHAGIPYKIGSCKNMQVLRRYGLFSRILGPKKIDLGHTIEQRECMFDRSPLETYGKSSPNTLHVKQSAYVFRSSKRNKLPAWIETDITRLNRILERAPVRTYLGPMGKPIQKRILTPDLVEQIEQLPDVFTEFSGRRLFYDDPPEPRFIREWPPVAVCDYLGPGDVCVPIPENVEDDPEDGPPRPPGGVPVPAVRVDPGVRAGQIKDVMELLEYGISIDCLRGVSG